MMRSGLFSTCVIAASVLVSAVPSWAFAQGRQPTIASSSVGAEAVTTAVNEAAGRFGLPAAWIRAVMRAESFGDARAVSPKGALGLMQLMPATFVSLRSQLQLGTNPFDVRDNVLAGAAYLRLMFDRYGVAGMIGAYNAGPERWEAYRAGARQLPSETLAYLTRLAPDLGFEPPGVQVITPSARRRSPFEAPLFPLASTSATEQSTGRREQVLAVIASNPTFVRQPADPSLVAEPKLDGGRQRRTVGPSQHANASPNAAVSTQNEVRETLFAAPTSPRVQP